MTVSVVSGRDLMQVGFHNVFPSGDGKQVILLWGENSSTNTVETLGSIGNSAYQVPTGKVLKIFYIRFFSSVQFDLQEWGYGDDPQDNNTTQPTNAVKIGSNSVSYLTIPASTEKFMNIYWETPASKYPYVRKSGASGTVSYMAWGIVENA